MDALMESRGSESTLNLSQAESAPAICVVPFVPAPEHPVTIATASAVAASRDRFIAIRKHESPGAGTTAGHGVTNLDDMPDELLNPDTAEMEARLRDIQERRRDRIRWNIGKHTAELAIAALRTPHEYKASGKCRRRKRAKRLL
jgi:hypothetical protein